MRIQFSLRSLIIMSLFAAIPVYWASEYYLERVQWPEMKERADVIDRLIQHIKNTKVMDSEVLAVYDFSHFSTDGSSEWTRLVRIVLDNPPRKKDDNEHAYSMRISCSRSHFQIEPLLIEYDNALENETLIAELQKLFDEKHWQYTLKKVPKLPNRSYR